MATFSASQAPSSAKRAVREAAPWIRRLARAGFAAKGVVYLIIGWLALQAAIGTGGQTTDSEGALQTLLRQPYGWMLLGLVAAGLAGYALWMFVRAALDPEGSGGDGDAKRMAARAGYAIRGAIHVALALEAGRMAIGFGTAGQGDAGPQDWTALALNQPFGRWIVAMVGFAILAFGLAELVKAYRTDLPKRLDLSRLTPSVRRWVIRFGRMGMAARGVVFGVIGGLVVRAAMNADASQARGLGGALATLHDQAYGRWLLGFVAVGLITYGLFEWVQARYRQIATS